MKIKAGTTIRIISICDDGAQELVGRIGTITYPFLNSMCPGVVYIAGVWLKDGAADYVGGRTNLVEGDQFEFIDESTAEEYQEEE